MGCLRRSAGSRGPLRTQLPRQLRSSTQHLTDEPIHPLNGTTMNIEVIKLTNTVEAIGAYSPAIKAGGFIFTSGQVGVDPANNEVPASFRHEVALAIDNLADVLHAAGSDLAHVVRMECLLSDIDDFGVMNEVYGEHFAAPFPARVIHGTVLAAGYRIELVATAVSA